jgi:hypothetical protein
VKDLDWPVTIVRDTQADPLAAPVDDDILLLEDQRSRSLVMRVSRRIVGREEIQRRMREERPVQRVLEVAVDGADRVVHSDQEDPTRMSVQCFPTPRTTRLPVVESAFDLDLVQKRAHAGQDLAAAEDLLAELHELGDGVAAIANALVQLGRDERSRLGLVELQAAREPFLGEEAGLCVVSPIGADADARASDRTWCKSSLASSLGISRMADAGQEAGHGR